VKLCCVQTVLIVQSSQCDPFLKLKRIDTDYCLHLAIGTQSHAINVQLCLTWYMRQLRCVLLSLQEFISNETFSFICSQIVGGRWGSLNAPQTPPVAKLGLRHRNVGGRLNNIFPPGARHEVAPLLVWVILRPCQHDGGYVDGRSQIKVHTDERTQVQSAWSSLTVTHPSTNRGRRCLTSVNVPLS